MVKVALLLLFAMASGFVGGVMYAREVYKPLVDWMHKHEGGNDEWNS